MKKYIILSLILAAILCLNSLSVGAQSIPEIQAKNADALVTLGIMKGYEDGTLRLENKIKRSEFITLVVNLMGYNTDTDIGNVKVTFTDINKNHWAFNNIKLAIKYDLVSGYPDNTIAPNNDVTYAEALAVVIRALGYEKTLKGEWPENVVNKALELKLSTNLKLEPNHKLTRGEMSVIVYNALTVKFNR
ncbi:S-layer homology domain-containing protein [Acetivibrio straminisolvens]|uniref:Middle cell wall protein n=1 Tax=Acetivibrio straminisolvens JCM 21531 TaxID=1294263 RepID=W4V7R3_9FIRM|nr:S-layer homology domain-containing protein [Acetivibrio straminisolvens]GAE89267.1 middle cell wall protein precursor [Acetivibrio straminisolvens JCM 21531]